MAPSSWLTKQRKPELIRLAAGAGLDLCVSQVMSHSK
jgi:hypothetical protein